MSRIFRPIGKLADRIVCVIFALLFLQFPVYMTFYTNGVKQKLGEARMTIEEKEAKARSFGQTVDEYLNELAEDENPKVSGSAEVDLNTLMRFRRYEAAWADLKDSPIWLRPFYLIKHYDGNVHADMIFEPGLPLTEEAIIYGFLGLLFGMLITYLFRKLFGRFFKKDDEPEKVEIIRS